MISTELYFGYGSNLDEEDWNSSGNFLPWKEALEIHKSGVFIGLHTNLPLLFQREKGGA